MLNNSTKYTTTRLALNKVLYGFKIKELLDILGEDKPRLLEASEENTKPSIDLATTIAINLVAFLSIKPTPIPLIDYRPGYINTKDALDFASLKIKEYYDSRY